MRFFADIRTVFKTDDQRSIEYLGALYDNKEFLYDVIEDLINSNISNEVISEKKVLIKPNWVLHNLKPEDWMCLRTNDNFLLAAVEIVLNKKPKSIIIGDAPIQDCDWEKMIDKNFIEAINKLSVKYSTPITIKDFRRTIWISKNNKVITVENPSCENIIFDVGEQSMLESVCNDKKNLFRIVNYSPDILAKNHKHGMHKYCITKDLFESDVVITIPKVKTHQKTGFTNSMKILVGVNTDKEFLPHHRMGATKDGGDCYQERNVFRYLAELSFDEANKNRQTNWVYQFYYFFCRVFWKLSFSKKEYSLGASWYGNDTCWRMVFDVNKVAVYGKKDGTISNEPQRVIYSLCDGIIGGQGNGPLQPTPLPLGMVSFTNNAALMDVAYGYLFKLKHEKIPFFKKAKELVDKMDYTISMNKNEASFESLSDYSIDVILPLGWQNYDN
ncbi:MAG: DUF362 domain-containing protein [Deltaproteobacteria bacterium]